MKISYRILFINFFVVLLIVGSSSVAFYSIVYNVLTKQQSKYLLKSSNDFILAYNEAFQTTKEDFHRLSKTELFSNEILRLTKVDFVLEQKVSNPKIISRAAAKEEINIERKNFSLEEFIDDNPSAIIKSHKIDDETVIYYGRLLTDDFLNSIAQKINAQVAIITDNSVLQVSNQSTNQKYIYSINKAYNNLSRREKFEVYSDNSDQSDLIATLCPISASVNENQNVQFLIFSNINEAANLRSSITEFLITVGITGVLLSLILTFVFTQRIRTQLNLLSNATKLTTQGNFKNKIDIKSKDEIGDLAAAFNNMLDELDKHHYEMGEYTDFLALLNRNASLKEIADAALNKIIKTCGFTVGAIYSVRENAISLIRTYGIKAKNSPEDFEFFEPAIKNQEMLELNFEKNILTVSSGLVSLEIKHMIIFPIVYNHEVISVIELGSTEKPSQEVKTYLSKIHDQLAIGLNNAFALVQLENLVVELRLLNEEYSKQNEQIKQQNDTLLKLHEELKIKAKELEIQKHKAEESTRLKSEFLASMSHELRTPMNSVLGLTELILEDASSLNPKTKERLEIVYRSGKRLMSLINDILDLSKIEAGKMEIKHDETLLEDIIFDVDTSIRPLALKKQLQFNILRKINTNIALSTDRGKVTQVLINLLGNAVKFTDTGSVELHISSQADNLLRFDIIDTGIGISPENQEIIFEEFRQIDGTSTRKYSGTGLGLSICKKIADMLGGSLLVESEVNKGSKFSFIIPLNIILESKITSVLSANNTKRKSRNNPILVIHKDEQARLKISEYLLSKGYKVICSENSNEALTLAKQQEPFALVVDIFSQPKDGWTILKEIKEDKETRDIPIILISMIVEESLGYGINVYEYFVNHANQTDLLYTFSKLERYMRKKVEKLVLISNNENEYTKFKSMLAKEKITVYFVKSNQWIFSEIININPDVIITNLFMPSNDGIKITHELKNHIETKNIPIIVNVNCDLNEEERMILSQSVTEATDIAKKHPTDVLKILRDRIRMDELSSFFDDPEVKLPDEIIEIEHAEKKPILNANDVSLSKSIGEVLIVDDDPDTLYTINEIVQSCNCKTLLAKNGIECLKILEENTPDLILLDIMMPEMDGFQTIKKIRENLNWKHIPVFAITARAMLEDRQIILKNGFDDYISKPVNTGVVSFKIEKLFLKIRVK